MRAMVKLKEQGKIRAIGVSNYDVTWMRSAGKITRLASDQPPYSLIQRKIEAEILPYCREHRIGVIVYSPLERGLLTGKVTPQRTFPEGDHRREHGRRACGRAPSYSQCDKKVPFLSCRARGAR